MIRIPVIPTINDSMGEMTEIFTFIKGFKNVEAVHLLPYHNIKTEKYNRLGKQYEFLEMANFESPNMDEIKSLFAAKFRTKVGG